MPGLVFYGMSDSTPAARAVFAKALGGRTVRKARRKAKKAVRAVRRARAATGRVKRPARLVKGSAAAKRYMASIRRKRR